MGPAVDIQIATSQIKKTADDETKESTEEQKELEPTNGDLEQKQQKGQENKFVPLSNNPTPHDEILAEQDEEEDELSMPSMRQHAHSDHFRPAKPDTILTPLMKRNSEIDMEETSGFIQSDGQDRGDLDDGLTID